MQQQKDFLSLSLSMLWKGRKTRPNDSRPRKTISNNGELCGVYSGTGAKIDTYIHTQGLVIHFPRK